MLDWYLYSKCYILHDISERYKLLNISINSIIPGHLSFSPPVFKQRSQCSNLGWSIMSVWLSSLSSIIRFWNCPCNCGICLSIHKGWVTKLSLNTIADEWWNQQGNFHICLLAAGLPEVQSFGRKQEPFTHQCISIWSFVTFVHIYLEYFYQKQMSSVL